MSPPCLPLAQRHRSLLPHHQQPQQRSVQHRRAWFDQHCDERHPSVIQGSVDGTAGTVGGARVVHDGLSHVCQHTPAQVLSLQVLHDVGVKAGMMPLGDQQGLCTVVGLPCSPAALQGCWHFHASIAGCMGLHQRTGLQPLLHAYLLRVKRGVS